LTLTEGLAHLEAVLGQKPVRVDEVLGLF